MKKSDIAVNYFKQKYNCSQSVLTVFGQDFGISEDNCLKLACVFGAGIAKQQQICGAVSGALMVLGLVYGRGENDEVGQKQISYNKSHEFFKEFKKIHGSIICKELLNGLDMNNPEEFKKIEEQKLFETKCTKCIMDAVEIIEEMIS